MWVTWKKKKGYNWMFTKLITLSRELVMHQL